MNKELMIANADIMTIVSHTKRLGWESISVNSLHRIIYLLKVLYSFNNADKNIFSEYHFSLSPFGPHSILIYRGVVCLLSLCLLEGEPNGEIKIISTTGVDLMEDDRVKWIETILLILSKYGEEKIFSFIMKDPLYDEATKSNLTTEIKVTPENETLVVLNDFKKAFEETLPGPSSAITKEEYVSLYFDYIFSKIIKE